MRSRTTLATIEAAATEAEVESPLTTAICGRLRPLIGYPSTMTRSGAYPLRDSIATAILIAELVASAMPFSSTNRAERTPIPKETQFSRISVKTRSRFAGDSLLLSSMPATRETVAR
jgi:hypothetical protein